MLFSADDPIVSQALSRFTARNRKKRRMPDREEIFEAIRSSWSIETCGEPEKWTPDNPAKGQCDASSFVAWEYLGGDLVLGKVLINGEQTEHHYWNRIDGEDFDLTRAQFVDGEDIVEVAVVENEFLKTNQGTMKAKVMARIGIMRDLVAAKVAT